MASRFKRSVPVTVNEVLDGHVALDLECLDRLYLHGYLGQLVIAATTTAEAETGLMVTLNQRQLHPPGPR